MNIIHGNSKYHKILTKNFLIREYINLEKSSYQIAKMIGFNHTTISNYLKKYNIKIRKASDAQKIKYSKFDKILTKEFLEKEYKEKEKSIPIIAKQIGCSNTSIWKYLKKYKMKIRSIKEAVNLINRIGKNAPNFKGEKAITRKIHYCIESGCNNEIKYCNWKYGNKRCQSCAVKYSFKIGKLNNSGKSNHFYGKITHGKGRYYKKIWMRSLWEIAFAQFLDLSNIEWQYESKTFDLGNATYTPDFYLPEWNLYIEIKGYWRDDAKEKFDLFKKNYPNKNIIVLMKPELQELGVL